MKHSAGPYQPKKKGGKPRLPPGTPIAEATLRSRAHRDRKRFETQSVEIAENALMAQIKTLVPADLPESVLESAQAKAEAALKLVIDNAEGITQALVNRALEGDIQASQLLISRFLPERRQLLKFQVKPTVDQTAHSIIMAAATGEMDASEAAKALSLLEKAGAVSLSGAIVDRINSLQEQIQRVSASLRSGDDGQIEIVEVLP
jgi:hypothetical protein